MAALLALLALFAPLFAPPAASPLLAAWLLRVPLLLAWLLRGPVDPSVRALSGRLKFTV